MMPAGIARHGNSRWLSPWCRSWTGTAWTSHPLQVLRRLPVDLWEQMPIPVISERHTRMTGTSRDLHRINYGGSEQCDPVCFSA
jgi:hypothetical protein